LKRLNSAILLLCLSISIHAGIVDPRVDFLISIKEQNASAPSLAEEVLSKDVIELHVRWAGGIDADVISHFEALGAEFVQFHSGRIMNPAGYSLVKAPWSIARQIANHRAFSHTDCSWAPKVLPPLDVSAPETGATEVWEITASDGYPLTGRGGVIANFDTGIDIFHPDFFHPDGGAFEYLDIDYDGYFTPGIDVVDLNGNGIPDFGEELFFFESRVTDYSGQFGGSEAVSNMDGIYQPDWDYLFLDQNANGVRDYGPENGFDSFDPGFGEPIFILAPGFGPDLGDGDTLLKLRSSKVLATYADYVTYTRGYNLANSPSDDGSHGTGVSSIIAGGHPGSRKFTGIAPGADLLAIYRYSVDLIDGMDWAAVQGATAFLWELGGWTWQYLDGSSSVERSIDAYSELGIMQVNPTGNLNGSGKHCHFYVAPSETTEVRFHFPNRSEIEDIWCTFLWTNVPLDSVRFQLHQPGGYSTPLRNGSNPLDAGGVAYCSFSTSPRGTHSLHIVIYDGFPDTSAYYFTVSNSSCCLLADIQGYIADNISSWGGGTYFDSFVAEETNTVTWPATADSAFGVASYSPRGYGNYENSDTTAFSGMISRFSGRGYRVSDYMPLVDIAAPGNYDVWASHSSTWSDENYGGYQQFGGTSAAGPHVAGAVALINQQYPSWRQRQISELITSTARRDSITGSSYNVTWGYGRLDLDAALTAIFENETTLPTQTALIALPNPFNSTVSIISTEKISEIQIFDILGNRVDVLSSETPRAAFKWTPESIPSGIYFARALGNRQSYRIIFLK